MTPPSQHRPEEMQRRLGEIESRVRYAETELELLEEHAGATQGYRDVKFLLPIVRSLESENERLRKEKRATKRRLQKIADDMLSQELLKNYDLGPWRKLKAVFSSLSP